MTANDVEGSAHASLRADALIERSCPVCGSDKTDRIFAEADLTPEALDGFAFSSRKLPEYMHYRIVACPQCDLLYSSPIPSPQFLQNAYQNASFDASDESRFASLTYARLLRPLLRELPDLDGALDIGTGDGTFLNQLLDSGFTHVVGIEPSAAPVAAAAPRVKHLIQQGPFRAADLEQERFSVVTCFQTMEHVNNPLKLCRDAYALLKQRGVLMLVCHNHRALSARLMGLKSPIFDIEHLQLFSPRSVRTALEMAGFSRVRVHTVVNRYPLQYWIKLAPIPPTLKTRVLRLLKTSGVGQIPLPAPVGNIAAVGYK